MPYVRWGQIVSTSHSFIANSLILKNGLCEVICSKVCQGSVTRQWWDLRAMALRCKAFRLPQGGHIHPRRVQGEGPVGS